MVQYGPALPKGIDIKNLYNMQELMNKMMKKYVEQVRQQPKQYIVERQRLDKLFGTHPAKGDQIIMYKDKGIYPSYAKMFLYGLDFDFMIL